MYLKSNILVDVQEQGTILLSRKILGNIDAERHYDFFSDMHASAGFQVHVIVLDFKYCTVKFPIVYFAVIIRIVVVGAFVLANGIIIIIRLFQCN